MQVNLTSTQLSILKSASKNKTGIIVRVNKKTLKMTNCHMNDF